MALKSTDRPYQRHALMQMVHKLPRSALEVGKPDGACLQGKQNSRESKNWIQHLNSLTGDCLTCMTIADIRDICAVTQLREPIAIKDTKSESNGVNLHDPQGTDTLYL